MDRPSSPIPSINYDDKKADLGESEHHEHAGDFVAGDETCFEGKSEAETKLMARQLVRKVRRSLFDRLALLWSSR